jgi:hypothetical protein
MTTVEASVAGLLLTLRGVETSLLAKSGSLAVI